MSQEDKVELIEVYRRVGNNYEFRSVSGELVRCNECRFYPANQIFKSKMVAMCDLCLRNDPFGYCHLGEKME